MKNWDGGGGIPLKVILAVWQSETKNEVISTFASFVPFLCACPGWVENSHLSCSEPGALWQVKQELSELVLDSWDQKRLVSGYFPIFSGLFLKKIAHWAARALQSGGKVSKPLARLHLKTVLVCQGVRKYHGQHAPRGVINSPPLPSRSGSSLSKKAPQLASWRKPSWGLRKREPKEKFIVVQAIMKPMHCFFFLKHIFQKLFVGILMWISEERRGLFACQFQNQDPEWNTWREFSSRPTDLGKETMLNSTELRVLCYVASLEGFS